jgi:sugar phosphate isomerase/epimerase
MTKSQIVLSHASWTNDDFPEIGNDYPYQVILEQTKEAGFEGGSTGYNYPSHLPSLRHAMESRGLKIASTWAGRLSPQEWARGSSVRRLSGASYLPEGRPCARMSLSRNWPMPSIKFAPSRF